VEDAECGGSKMRRTRNMENAECGGRETWNVEDAQRGVQDRSRRGLKARRTGYDGLRSMSSLES
jgi:hypothetical protein